jgi:SPW repeat
MKQSVIGAKIGGPGDGTGTPGDPGGGDTSAVLADRWWFWALAAIATVAFFATEPRWRRAAAGVRAGALRRRLVDGGAGTSVDPSAGGPWSEPWLAGVLVGVWVCAGPWIWGYDDVDGAVTADVVTGATIAVVSLAGVVFPALLALNLFAGLWLTTAPWLVGFGTEDGPVGLSDTIAGVVTCGLALRSLTLATRRLRAAQPGPIGRVQRRGTDQ